MADFIGNMIFGAIGVAAFIYGKKNSQYKAMIIGFLLLIFPYVVSGNLALYGIGTALTAALFVFRD